MLGKTAELEILKQYKMTTCYGRPAGIVAHDRAMRVPKLLPFVFMIAWAGAVVYASLKTAAIINI
jgi:hypothetical protein